MSSVTSTTGTSLQLQYKDPKGATQNVPFPVPMVQRPGGRDMNPTGQIIFVENFAGGITGLFNDGLSGTIAYVDPKCWFAGNPTMCLDPLGVISTQSPTVPASLPDNNGVICKRRIDQLVTPTIATAGLGSNTAVIGTNRFGVSGWMRFTSNGHTVNNVKSLSLYNRDGTNIYIGRIWLNTIFAGADRTQPNYLNSAGTWTIIDTYLGDMNGHGYDPSVDSYDQAGSWQYFKLVADFTAQKYVSFQFNENYYDLSAQPLFVQANTAPKTLHFSFEIADLSTAARRYMHISNIVGTLE